MEMKKVLLCSLAIVFLALKSHGFVIEPFGAAAGGAVAAGGAGAAGTAAMGPATPFLMTGIVILKKLVVSSLAIGGIVSSATYYRAKRRAEYPIADAVEAVLEAIEEADPEACLKLYICNENDDVAIEELIKERSKFHISAANKAAYYLGKVNEGQFCEEAFKCPYTKEDFYKYMKNN